MDSAGIVMTIALFCMVALSAYFSASETAFSSLNRIRVKNKADRGDARAALVLRLEQDYDRLISTILIGNNIANITATTLGTLLFVRLLGEGIGPAVSTAVLTVTILVLGEISPKSLAKESPERVAMLTAPLLRLFMIFLSPLSVLFAMWKGLLLRLMHKKEEEGITEEELITLVDQAEDQGGLDAHESQLIRSAIEFGDMGVQEIFTPRVDLVALEDSAAMDEAATLFAESGYSRLPVYHEDLDNIIGVIHEKDFYAARYRGVTEPKAVMGHVIYTASTTKISELLRILQREKAHMAVVVDEYGGTRGICTMEDIVEELVGEIWDEHDEVVESFRKQADGSYFISCSANLPDLYDIFSIRGTCDANTVSGWVMEQVGRIPEEGDRFTADGLDVTVTKVEHRRVLEIKVIVLPKEE